MGREPLAEGGGGWPDRMISGTSSHFASAAADRPNSRPPQLSAGCKAMSRFMSKVNGRTVFAKKEALVEEVGGWRGTF